MRLRSLRLRAAQVVEQFRRDGYALYRSGINQAKPGYVLEPTMGIRAGFISLGERDDAQLAAHRGPVRPYFQAPMAQKMRQRAHSIATRYYIHKGHGPRPRSQR